MSNIFYSFENSSEEIMHKDKVFKKNNTYKISLEKIQIFLSCHFIKQASFELK